MILGLLFAGGGRLGGLSLIEVLLKYGKENY